MAFVKSSRSISLSLNISGASLLILKYALMVHCVAAMSFLHDVKNKTVNSSDICGREASTSQFFISSTAALVVLASPMMVSALN
jgi:hypothetical protein